MSAEAEVPGTPQALLILGCGRLGMAVARLWRPGVVVGVRRNPSADQMQGSEPSEDQGCMLLHGDISSPTWWVSLPDELQRLGMPWPPRHVLFAATPGLRRQRDHGLREAASLITRHLPQARVVYSGTCAVYADSGGAAVTEAGALGSGDAAIEGLIAIETNLAPLTDLLVLRLPALVGAQRMAARERLRAGATTVSGSLDRPFPFLHERDAAELLAQALHGGFGRGVLNAASPQRIRVRDYYREIARALGVPEPVGNATHVRSLAVDAGRLWSMLPGRAWRGIMEE